MYNFFLLSSKKVPFEQYYRLHLTGPKNARCELSSSHVFVLDHTSFEHGNYFFLHALHEALLAFNNVLQGFGFSQLLEQNDPKKHPARPTSKHPFCYDLCQGRYSG